MKTNTSLATLLTIVFLGLLSNGCKCAAEDPPPTSETQKAEASAKPQLPEDVDKSLLAKLKEASAKCKENNNRITCRGGKKNAIVLSFNQGKRDKIEALPTFIRALQSKDPKLKALAAAVLYAAFRSDLGKNAKQDAIDPQHARELLDAALALPRSSSMQAIPVAVHAATLSGQAELLNEKLTEEVPVQVRTMAYRYLMVYGRLQAFEKIKELSTAPGTAIVLSAVESPRHMENWTPEERKAICPWARKFLSDSRVPVAGNAMAVLSNCRGEELDALLERVEKTLDDGQFSFIHATALRKICKKGPRSTDEGTKELGATEDQCQRVRELLKEASLNSSVKPRVRAMTLSNIAYTWPDEESLALAKKLKGESASEVQRSAKQIITRLKTQVGTPTTP